MAGLYSWFNLGRQLMPSSDQQMPASAPPPNNFVGAPGWQIPMAATPENDYLGTQYILNSGLQQQGTATPPAPPPTGPSMPSAPGGAGGYGFHPGSLSIDTSKAEDLYRQLSEKSKHLSEAERKQQEALRNNLMGQLQTPVQADLSPLAALVDSWTGSHLQQGYQRPQSAEEKRREIAQAEGSYHQAGQNAERTDMASLQSQAGQQMDLAKLGYGIKKDNLDIGFKRAGLDMEREKLALERAKAVAGPQVKPEQWQASLYGRRMMDANQILQQNYAKTGVQKYITSPSGALDRALPGTFQENVTKELSQAERNFVNAILRKESGSAISKEEFASAEAQYFPRAGDTPQVLAQKEQNRARAIEGMALASGPAWNAYQASSSPSVSDSSTTTSPQEIQQALQWASSNASDPRAQKIISMYGGGRR